LVSNNAYIAGMLCECGMNEKFKAKDEVAAEKLEKEGIWAVYYWQMH